MDLLTVLQREIQKYEAEVSQYEHAISEISDKMISDVGKGGDVTHRSSQLTENSDRIATLKKRIAELRFQEDRARQLISQYSFEARRNDFLDMLYDEFYFELKCKADAEARANWWAFWASNPYQNILKEYESVRESSSCVDVKRKSFLHQFELETETDLFSSFLNFINNSTIAGASLSFFNEKDTASFIQCSAKPSTFDQRRQRFSASAVLAAERVRQLFDGQTKILQEESALEVSARFVKSSFSATPYPLNVRQQKSVAAVSDNELEQSQDLISQFKEKAKKAIAALYGYATDSVGTDVLLKSVKGITGNVGCGFLWLSPPLEYRTIEHLVRDLEKQDVNQINMVDVTRRIQRLRQMARFSESQEKLKQLDMLQQAFTDIRLELYQPKIDKLFAVTDAERAFHVSVQEQEKALPIPIPNPSPSPSPARSQSSSLAATPPSSVSFLGSFRNLISSPSKKTLTSTNQTPNANEEVKRGETAADTGSFVDPAENQPPVGGMLSVESSSSLSSLIGSFPIIDNKEKSDDLEARNKYVEKLATKDSFISHVAKNNVATNIMNDDKDISKIPQHYYERYPAVTDKRLVLLMTLLNWYINRRADKNPMFCKELTQLRTKLVEDGWLNAGAPTTSLFSLSAIFDYKAPNQEPMRRSAQRLINELKKLFPTGNIYYHADSPVISVARAGSDSVLQVGSPGNIQVSRSLSDFLGLSHRSGTYSHVPVSINAQTLH